MRFVLVGPVYPYRGGIAHHTAQLAHALKERGHRVLVISFKRQYPSWLYPGASDKDPSQIFTTTDADFLLDPIYPWTWHTAIQRIKHFSPDLVVFQWWTTFWAFAFASISNYCRRNEISVAYLLHNVLPHEPHWWDPWLARRALHNGKTIIAQNPHEARKLLDLLPDAQVKICEMPVYNGIISPIIPKAEARKMLQIEEGCPVVLFFGIVRPYKGLHILLNALAIMKENGRFPLLVAAGEFWDDQNSYLQQIKELGLKEQVRVDNRYIPNEDAGIYFSAADVLVAPYLAGTQSAAAALALGRGMPVILTERIAAGIPHAYRDLIRVVPAGDAEALANSLENFLDIDTSSTLPQVDPNTDWERLVQVLESL